MKILAIETSCDETAIAIIDAEGGLENPRFSILSNLILSQVKLHAQYGGVYPTLAKREHARNLIPLLKESLTQAQLLARKDKSAVNVKVRPLQDSSTRLSTILEREPELHKQFLEFIPSIETPDIDAIAVTYGPGLEPALWVGINFAKALAQIWNKPLIPINHMEGHIFSALLKQESRKEFSISNFQFPILALLISGGHTELVLMKDWFTYELIGETRDDAVGEAFDKVARMLNLSYPGGPAIAEYAENFKPKNKEKTITLPRPMLHSGDYDFSFSGLKTAVLYLLKKTPHVTEKIKQEIAYEFQEAATDILVTKTLDAARDFNAKTILVGGGVSANKRIREELTKKVRAHLPDLKLYISPQEFTGDNALMIAVAGYARICVNPHSLHSSSLQDEVVAEGSLRLAKSN